MTAWHVRVLTRGDVFAMEMSKNAKIGRDLITRNEWHLPKFGNAKIGSPPDWTADPFKSRSWVWFLHQFHFITNLIAYDRETQTGEGAKWAMKAVRSWWEEFADLKSASAHAWHDHGSAKRAEQFVSLCKHLRALRGWESQDQKVIQTDLRHLGSILDTHASFLADESNYSKNTNHGMAQSLSLLIVCLERRRTEWASDFKRLALQRIFAEAKFAFSLDGGHHENSIQYHRYGITQLLKAITWCERDPDQQDSSAETLQGLRELLDRATLALAYMIRPDGQYPPVGDTEVGSDHDIFVGHKSPESHSAFMYALTKGAQGVPPDKPDLILPQSGWAILRSGWRDENELHLVTKCGYHSDYHRHDDDMSFVLFAFGEDWIIDGGLFNYEERNPIRAHLRSHYAHSLSAPDNVDPVRRQKTHGGQNRITGFTSGNERGRVEMESYMFPGYRAQGSIELMRASGCVAIEDRIAPTQTRTEHQCYITRFLVPGDKSVTWQKNSVIITGVNRRMFIQPNKTVHRIFIESGQESPQPRGWYSPQFNKVIPAISIGISHHSENLEIGFHLTFEDL